MIMDIERMSGKPAGFFRSFLVGIKPSTIEDRHDPLYLLKKKSGAHRRIKGDIMMKWNIYFMDLLTFITMSTGCASLGSVFYHEPHEITQEDANKIHPRSRHKDTHKRLTLEESRKINKLYGEEMSQEGDFIAYYNARHMKPLYPLTKGNIFLVHTNGEKDNSLTLLVCATEGSIHEVILKNNFAVGGKRIIPGEFLQQFIGRSLGHSWEMAKAPSDLLSFPNKIRPISGYPKVSEELASAIRKVLVFAQVLGIA